MASQGVIAAPQRSAHRAYQVLGGRAPALFALGFLAVHAVMAAAVDSIDPDVFLRADRAHERLRVLQGLLDVGSMPHFIQYLASHGVVGDYAVHAGLYGGGGRYAVIFVQVGLAILSGLAVSRLAILLGLSRGMAALAMAVYLSLPHTLVFPHQLVTEALHVPLFVISNWALAEGLHSARPSMLRWSALLLGIATLIRPITLLWPFAASAAVAGARRPRDAVMYGCIALAPVALWMMFVWSQTGRFGLGESDHSMTRNLYERVARITAAMPRADSEAARAAYLDVSDRKLGPIAYFRFSAEHPLPALEHLLRDASVFFGKSGVERITLDYFAIAADSREVQSPTDGWRRQLELHGVAHTVSYLWAKFGAVLIVSIAGAAFIMGLTFLALVAVVHSLRRGRKADRAERGLILILAGVVLYTLLFSQVLNAMQSRQRAPAEFALVLLAAYTCARFARRSSVRSLRPGAAPKREQNSSTYRSATTPAE